MNEDQWLRLGQWAAFLLAGLLLGGLIARERDLTVPVTVETWLPRYEWHTYREGMMIFDTRTARMWYLGPECGTKGWKQMPEPEALQESILGTSTNTSRRKVR